MVCVPINHSFPLGEKLLLCFLVKFIENLPVCIKMCSFIALYLFLPAGSAGSSRTIRAGGEYAVLLLLRAAVWGTQRMCKTEGRFSAGGFSAVTENENVIK